MFSDSCSRVVISGVALWLCISTRRTLSTANGASRSPAEHPTHKDSPARAVASGAHARKPHTSVSGGIARIRRITCRYESCGAFPDSVIADAAASIQYRTPASLYK